MIMDCIKAGFLDKALGLYRFMPSNDCFTHLNGHTFVCLMQVCAKAGDVRSGFRLHFDAARTGFLEGDLYIGNNLVDMYSKHGLLMNAQQVFLKLPLRDVVSWTTMISGYVEHGHIDKALSCFKYMEFEGVSPNVATFVCILKACGVIRAIEKGHEIHAYIQRKGLLESECFMNSALVDMYGKCGLVTEAQIMFDKLQNRDVVSWTTLIIGYVEQGYGEEAIECFERMQLEGVCPNYVTFIAILKACGSMGVIDKGIEIHTEIERKGLLHILPVANMLVDMYVKFGLLGKAREAFETILNRDVVSWTTLLAGYCEYGHGKEALECFGQMQFEGILPNTTTLVCGLNACGIVGALERGQEIHLEIERQGLVKEDPVVGNALIDMYAKCGTLAKAHKLFQTLPLRNTVSWNTLITGYVEHGRSSEALKCFNEMKEEGSCPDHITFLYGLKACGGTRFLGKGRQTHADVERLGFHKDLSVGSALVEMYAKNGAFVDARKVLDMLVVRNTASWNVLMEGYNDYGRNEEVLMCFEEMQHEGVSPNVVTFLCTLKSCGCLGQTNKAREIYAQIESNAILDTDNVRNSVANIYAKCGWLERAEKVFDKLSVPNVVSWNALISGYSKMQNGKEALKCFSQMKLEGLFPNSFTYVCGMRACSMIQDAVEGQEIHAKIKRFVYIENESVVSNNLMCMKNVV